MGTNNSKLSPPAVVTAASKPLQQSHAGALMLVYFRQSADGTTFTITPVYLPPAEAAQSVGRLPYEYSFDGVAFATWPGAYRNGSQVIGGRGRLAGSCVMAD